MTMHAEGAFDVQLTPQPPEEDVGDPSVARMALVKRFHGDLEATSKGQMLATTTSVPGSAGYVAIERVTGTLAGRAGSFSLLHRGTMEGGAQDLAITVIPDSGAGELQGLSGTMTIEITGGMHVYELEYELPATA